MNTRQKHLLLIASFFRMMTLMAFAMVLQYRLRELGASLFLISMLAAVTGGMQSITSPLWGKIADASGLRGRLLLLIGVVAVLLYPLYGFLSLPVMFLFIAGAIAFFEAGFNPIAMSLMSEGSGEDVELRSHNLALFNAASAAGILAGRLSLSAALSILPVATTVLLLAIGTLGAALPTLFLPARSVEPTKTDPPPRPAGYRHHRLQLFPRKEDLAICGMWAVYLGTFIRNIGVAGFISISALYMKEGIGLSESHSMLVAGIDPLCMFIAHLYFGRKLVRFGIKRTMLLGTLITILSFTFFWLATSWILTILGWICIGLAYGAFHNASVTFISLYFPSARRAEGIGYIWTANTLGIMLGPLIAGALAESSYSLMLLGMIGFSLLGLLILWSFVASDERLQSRNESASQGS
ncbi:MAG: MFS transporter [Spirochaetota bacterium]